MKKVLSVLLILSFVLTSCIKTSGNSNKCTGIIDAQSQFDCYHRLAVETLDYSICENINNSDRKNYCYQDVELWCSLKIEREEYGSRVCVDIEDKELRKKCISATTQRDADKCKKELPKICNKINKVEDKEFCIAQVAVINNEVGICENITTSYIKESCYVNIAEVNKDLAICQNIQNEYVKNICYGKVAAQKQDISICENIQDKYEKEHNCYGLVHTKTAELKKDATECDKILEGDQKDICYRDLAQIKKDVQICVKIKPLRKQEYCNESVKRLFI